MRRIALTIALLAAFSLATPAGAAALDAASIAAPSPGPAATSGPRSPATLASAATPVSEPMMAAAPAAAAAPAPTARNSAPSTPSATGGTTQTSAGSAAPVFSRSVTLAEVSTASLPVDMTSPEGTTRWDLTGVVPGSVMTRTLDESAASVTRTETRTTPAGAVRTLVTDPAGGDAAKRWLLPDHFADTLRPGSRETLVIDETRDGATQRLRIVVDTVGIGWVHLPSGPREVSLQRALVTPQQGGSGDLVIYRWVDPRAGVAAEITGPAGGDGRSRLGIDSATVLEDVLTGASTLKLYVNQVEQSSFSAVNYGWDRGSGTAISSLTPDHFATIGALISANSWDFSGNNTGSEIGSTTTPVNSSETCNNTRCGYTEAGALLDRRDTNWLTPASLNKDNTVRKREDRGSDVVLWLRAGAQHEGVSGSFGNGESRFCYLTDGTGTRTPVPEWDFTHQDAGGFFVQAGDSWSSGTFNCEQNLFNQTCGANQLFPILYSRGWDGSGSDTCQTHQGKQSFAVLKGGVITLPSGHTLNSLLVRTVADFCVYSASGCNKFFKLSDVNTVVYLWAVPYLGTVNRIQSVQNASDLTSWTTADETDIQFGLFPPRTISTTGQTETSVSLSWDPGLDTHRINRYKVYWDTDSGGSTPYAFNSQANPGQVSIAGTTATVSGLTRGTNYFFTVTSLSDFKDPSTNVTTTYESLLYPTQVSGDPSFVYPIEVLATTQCVPTAEVHNVRVTRPTLSTIQICWDPVTDACLQGYRVLGATSPQLDTNFSTVADVGLTTCWTGSTTNGFFLVVARGIGATGPWGDFGH